MIKKQWLLVVLLVILSSFVFGADIPPIDLMTPINNTDEISSIVNFQCRSPLSDLDNITFKVKTFGEVGWLPSQTKTATAYEVVSFDYSFPAMNAVYEWNCFADSDPLLGAVSNWILNLNINTDPTISTINDQNRSIESDVSWILNLEENKSDSEDSGSALTWSVENPTGYDSFCTHTWITDDVIQFTRITNTPGVKTYKFILTDSEGLTDEQNVKVYFYESDSSSNTAPSCSTVPDQEWDEGESESLDLGSYCSDSDGDSLTYLNNSGMNNISVSISGDTVTFSSDNNWIGSRDIRFNVSDGTTSVLTNEFRLTTVDDDSPSTSTTTVETTTSSNVIIITSPSPVLNTINMKVGESKKFKINLKNSISDIIYNWYVDDSKIIGASNKDYTYKPTKSGSYELKVIAKKGGDDDFHLWTVKVGDAVETVNETVEVIEESSGAFDFMTGFSIKETAGKVFSGKKKWYWIFGVIIVVLVVLILVKTKAGKKSDLTHYGGKDGFLKRLRKKLADKELKRREKKALIKSNINKKL